MNTRRKFILQGSMAAAAVLASKPFKAIASGNNKIMQWGYQPNHLVLMHTAGLQPTRHQATLKFIGNIKNKTSNAVVLDAAAEKGNAGLVFDMSATDVTTFTGKEYRIITRGGIHTGVIVINKYENGLFNKVNQLAAFLKTEKKCKVVVCMSQLGYSLNNKKDDKELAAQSVHLDIIIGTHTVHFTKHPMITFNSRKEEVILQSASSNDAAFGKIEIGFDPQGNKNHIHILNKIPRMQGQQNCIVAA